MVHSCQEKVPNKKVLEIVFLFSLTSAPRSSHSPSLFTGQYSHDHRVQPRGGVASCAEDCAAALQEKEGCANRGVGSGDQSRAVHTFF